MAERASPRVVAFHRDVMSLCVDRLREALSAETSLFDRQLRDKRWDSTLGTENTTSTAICLVGLHRAGIDPGSIRLDATKSIGAMADSVKTHDYPGGIGLVIWANAVWQGLPFDALLARAGTSLAQPGELAPRLTTMEVAWLLSGLAHEVARSSNPLARSAMSAVEIELSARFQADTRLFRHASDSAPIMHLVRKWVANFADQIYSVQALAFAGLAGDGSEALAASDACAARLVELQGKLGQWWWHYDPRDGNVAQGYPVYSVHQHAMAPMALMTLAAAGGKDHRAAVELSHDWIGNNELGVNLLDRDAGTLWRDIEIEEGALNRFARHTKSVIGLKSPDFGVKTEDLKVNHETRPYEWAWCLFAGAIAEGGRVDGHLV